MTVQITIHPDGRLHLLVHFEPTLWSELTSVRTPHVLVPATETMVSARLRMRRRLGGKDSQVVSGYRDGDNSLFWNR